MRTRLIFGSTALKHWFPDYKREPKDLDVITKEKSTYRKVDHYWIDSHQYILDNNKDCTYVDPDFLYTIKVSHAAWDIWWDKTMSHIMFLKDKGCKLDNTLYKLLYDEWMVHHKSNKRINLNRSNAEFFKDAVKREFDHDYLHEVFAYYDKPMHTRIRPDVDRAYCSQKLWDLLSHEDKVKCALEEIHVIAFERFILKGERYPIAKRLAMKNLILTMTKGWFNLFLIDNFKELLYSDINVLVEKSEVLLNEYKRRKISKV